MNFLEKLKIPLFRDEKILLILILTLGFFLRIHQINFLLPYFFHPDEELLVKSALGIVKTGNFHPGVFKYGSLPVYLTVLIYFIFFKISGISPQGFLHYQHNFILYYLGRYFSLAAGLAIIWLTFRAAKKLFGQRVGLLSALMVAVCPLAIERAVVFNVDSLSVLFVLLAFQSALEVKEQGKWRDYLWGGAFCGLAIATKYIFIVFIPLGAAHLFYHRSRAGWRKGILDLKIWVSFYLALLVFVLTCPYLILDLEGFIQNLFPFFLFHSSPPAFYLKNIIYQRFFYQFLILFPAILGPTLYLAGILGLVRLAREKFSAFVLLFSFPFFFLLGGAILMRVPFHMHYYPILPFMVMVGSYLTLQLWSESAKLKKALSLFLLVTSLIFFLSDIFYSQYRPFFEVHERLGKWAEENVRAGEDFLLVGWYFTPATNFWSGDRKIGEQRTLRVVKHNLQGFDLNFIRRENPDYLAVFYAKSIESDSKLFKTSGYWETLRALLIGRMNYQISEVIELPRIWGKLVGFMYPEMKDFKFIIFKNMKNPD